METKIWKFGGAFFSPEVFSNFIEIFLKEKQQGNRILCVVSAMAGITRLLRLIFEAKTGILDKDHRDSIIFQSSKDFLHIHNKFISKVFKEDKEIQREMKIFFGEIFVSLHEYIESYKEGDNEDKFYASLLSYGEILSSKIFHMYLCSISCESILFNARDHILTTEDNCKEATVKKVDPSFKEFFSKSQFLVTQGFIAKSISSGCDTVLGLDGSDYSAALFAIKFGSEGVLIFWKDIEGFYSENPKVNPNAEISKRMLYSKYSRLPSHPIQPKAVFSALNKGVYVEMKCFLFPHKPGSIITF